MKILTLPLAGLAFAMFVEVSAASSSTLTIDLHAQNGSGESGTATLTQMGRDVEVAISLKGAPLSTPQPAHIHDGTCASIKGVVYPLTNVVNGKSKTIVRNVTVGKLLAGTYAINVHESTANLGKYVACGAIVAKP